jgi:hypothetical protein
VRFTRRSNRFVVLGCGPAGLFAATALEQNGHSVRVISRKRKSEIFGTQYLHAPIPELTPEVPQARVEYRLTGTVEAYREKVYGESMPNLPVSPQTLDYDHDAWDIRAAYEKAWERWEPRIEDVRFVTPDIAKSIAHSGVHRVLSTIPAFRLCEDSDHQFASQRIWAAGDAPERGLFCPVDVAEEGQILCDGTRDVGWYRQSRVFGFRTVEWPYREERRPPISGLSLIDKPLFTNCDCPAKNIVRLGRYGAWTKGILSHSAYQEAAKF